MGSQRILLTAGSNAKGQLGIGSYDDAHAFTPCQFAGCEPNQLPISASRATHIACGANHTVLLLQRLDGSTTLWGTGDGRRGQLGPGYFCGADSGSEERGPEPGLGSVPWTTFHELVLGPEPSWADSEYTHKHVAAAWETTYVVLARPGGSDVLLSMGSDEFGALGGGGGGDGRPQANTAVPQAGSARVVSFDHVFPDDAGREACRTVCVRSLHAGPRHVVAQLVMTSAATHSDGSSARPRCQTVLVGWGASRHGQLGQNGGVRFVARPTRLPVDVDDDPMVSCALGNQHTVVLHASGRISAFGSNKQGQIPSLGSHMRICGLGCTWNGTYMQTIEGDEQVLRSVGNNAQGQLGRGCTTDTAVSLPADRALSGFVCGSEHVLATMSSSSRGSDSVVGWGWNEHGNMGLGSLGNVSIPTQLWPREDVEVYRKYPQKVVDIWAGCATSWLLVE